MQQHPPDPHAVVALARMLAARTRNLARDDPALLARVDDQVDHLAVKLGVACHSRGEPGEGAETLWSVSGPGPTASERESEAKARRLPQLKASLESAPWSVTTDTLLYENGALGSTSRTMPWIAHAGVDPSSSNDGGSDGTWSRCIWWTRCTVDGPTPE